MRRRAWSIANAVLAPFGLEIVQRIYVGGPSRPPTFHLDRRDR